MSRNRRWPAQPSRTLTVPLNRNTTQKLLLIVLLTAVVTFPLCLGLARVHSAPASVTTPPTSPSPIPTVTLSVPAQALIGSQIKFKATFANTNALGYAPFIDLVLDAGGKNITKTPNCACDGITFVSANMVGVNGGPLDLTPVTKVSTPSCVNAPSTIAHPFAGILPVNVPAGAQLVSIPLPFGSFDPTQPPVEVEITANLSNFADANWPLKISARGGFLLGIDPLDNPVPDRPILSDETSTGLQITNSAVWHAQATTTPVVMLISKSYLGPEGENATGPNYIGFYPLKYKLSVLVAPGQTVTNVALTDCLPSNMAYHQLVSVTPAVPASAITEPAIDIPASPNCLSVTWATLSGGGSVVFEFFIPEQDAFANPVLPPNCKPATSVDTLKVEADWTPLDPCDSPQHIVNGPVTDTLKDKCLAIQKSVKLFYDGGAPGYTPGDLLEYTLNFQISDYKTFSAIDIVDSLSDGQQLQVMPPALTPKLIVTDQFGTASGYFVLNNDLTAVADANLACGAGTRITFNVSQKMIDLAPPDPRQAAGILTGGYATSPKSFVPATGQIVFYARILDQFAFPHPGDQYVDKEDPLTNCVEIGGKVMTNGNPPAMPASTGFDAHDDSSTAIAIVGDTLTKTVYAVTRKNALGNAYVPVCGLTAPACANAPQPPQEVRAGDRVTYRLQKTIPSNDAEKLSITDWLPRPVYDLTSTAFPFTNSGCVAPGPGTGCLGPSHDPPGPLSVVADPVTNSIKFDFGTFFDVTNPQRKIDLLFTNTVTNTPFADGLHLTNVAQECEENTFAAKFCQVAIAQVNLREPSLKIRKGAIATSSPWGVFTHPGLQTATLATAASPRAATTFSLSGINGLINSNDLLAGFVNDDLSNVDANDVVNFAITIENVGGAPAYDVKMEDLIPLVGGNPSCFTIVPGSFKVQRGNGTPVFGGFYSIGFPLTNHGFTVTSTPNLPIPLSAYNATSGANIVVITFQAQMLGNIMPGCCDNRANLLHYSSELNGQDFVAANLTPPFTDTASVCVKPGLTKSLVATSEAHTSGANVTIGEIARYRLTIELPETGLLPGFKVTDALPAGLKYLSGSAHLAFVSDQSPITRGPLVSAPAYTFFPASAPPPSAWFNTSQPILPLAVSGGGGCGAAVTFNLGNVKNNDSDSNREYIVIEFDAQVCNVATNQSGAPLPNSFSVSVNNATIATSPALNLTVVEPSLTIVKAASPATVAQGGTIGYTVTVTNTSTTQAFDVSFTDTLPAGLNFVSGSTSVTGACVLATTTAAAPAVICGSVAGGGVVTIKYNAIANPVSCPATLTNQAAVTWSSLRGPKGTAINPTFSNPTVVLGSSGAGNGERNGITPLLTLNDYAAATSKSVTVNCPPCVQPPQGMSAWWSFDEANGATAVNDFAGVNNAGAPKPGNTIGAPNAPGAVAGRVSGAFNFNSAGASTGPNVEVPDHPEINFGTGNFTIDAWVLLAQPSAIYFHPIVDKLQMNSAGTTGTGYALNLVSSFSTGARLQLTLGTSGPLLNYGPNAPSVPFNAWTHVTVTVNRGTGVVTFYINGTQLPPSGPPLPAGSLDNNLPLLIGESRFLGLGQQAITLDELELFKRALPQPEIQGIVNAGGGGKCKCLRASNEVVSCGANGT
ncbi:MAG: hypothetical protein QOD33_856, partial [Pyrinomonadaceae bacterium]|nr:hypothetical protein [Pyrinomonadaceae bacterium]